MRLRPAAGILSLLLVLLTATLVAVLGFFPVTNLDVGLHIRTGQTIVNNLAVPHTNIFSAVNADYPMTDDKWLFQVIVYLIHGLGGFDALVAFRLILLALLFGLLTSIEFDRQRVVASLLPAAIAAVAASERFMLRPDLASLVLLGAYLFILRRDQLRPAGRWLYAIPALHLLWVNTHGYFLTGFLVIGCFWLAEVLRSAWSRWRPGSIGTRIDRHEAVSPTAGRGLTYTWLLAACIGVSFINPNFAKGALFPLRTLSELWGKSHVLLEGIPEFFSPWEHFPHRINAVSTYRILAIAGTAVLLAAFLVDLMRRRTGRRPILPGAYLLIYGAFLLMSIQMRRNIAQFALVSIPILALSWRSLAGEVQCLKPKLFALASRCAALIMLAGLAYTTLDVVSNRFYFRDRSPRFFGHGVSRVLFPQKAFEFVKKVDPSGNLFNTFGTGSWFVYALYPARRPFIDGNTFGYDISFYNLYYDALTGRVPYQEFARENRIDWFFLAALEADPVMVGALYRDPRWGLVYFDGNTFIFVRRSEENSALLAAREIDLNDLSLEEIERRIAWFEPEAGWASRLSELAARLIGAPGDYPLVWANGGYFLAHLGELDKARALYQEAIARNPDLFEGHVQLGWIQARQGDRAGGLEQVREGLRLAPGYADGWAILADLEQQAGDEAAAEDALRRAVAMQTRGVTYLRRLARLLRKRNERAEALALLREGLRRRPRDPNLLSEAVTLEIETGALADADRDLAALEEVAPDNVANAYYRGLLAQATGRWREAVGAYRRYLADRPGLPDVLFHVGSCLVRAGKEPEAREALEEALRHDPPRGLRHSITALLQSLNGRH